MKIIRRTFEALRYPKGSSERDRCNLSAETSEYMTSQRYLFVDERGSKTGTRTKQEAQNLYNERLKTLKACPCGSTHGEGVS